MVSALLHEDIPASFVRLDDPDGQKIVTNVMNLDVETNKHDLLVSLGRVAQLAKFDDEEDLECPDEIRQRARTLAEQAEERGVTTGVHPAGFAAACLYKAGREEGRWLTQSEIAGAATISTTTIWTHRDALQQLDEKHIIATKGEQRSEEHLQKAEVR